MTLLSTRRQSLALSLCFFSPSCCIVEIISLKQPFAFPHTHSSSYLCSLNSLDSSPGKRGGLKSANSSHKVLRSQGTTSKAKDVVGGCAFPFLLEMPILPHGSAHKHPGGKPGTQAIRMWNTTRKTLGRMGRLWCSKPLHSDGCFSGLCSSWGHTQQLDSSWMALAISPRSDFGISLMVTSESMA